ncbi:hypothetical protein [Alkalihalobacterium bogoriense]|nr:hypothetical protein [Alkalihalobacterium bogoriense]
MGDWNEQASRNLNLPRPHQESNKDIAKKMVEADIQDEVSRDARRLGKK